MQEKEQDYQIYYKKWNFNINLKNVWLYYWLKMIPILENTFSVICQSLGPSFSTWSVQYVLVYHSVGLYSIFWKIEGINQASFQTKMYNINLFYYFDIYHHWKQSFIVRIVSIWYQSRIVHFIVWLNEQCDLLNCSRSFE